MTLNYTLFTQLPVNYYFVYLPNKRSRIPRVISSKTTATVEIKGVPAVPAYEVTNDGQHYIICVYKDRLYWPISRDISSYAPYDSMVTCHDNRADYARPYFQGTDDEKYAYDPAKSIVLYDDKQAINTVKDWASKHLIAFNSMAYIELKNPLISVSFLTDSLNLDSFISDDEDFDRPYDFRLDQLTEFKQYINHYKDNLIYKIEHKIGHVQQAESDLKTLTCQLTNNQIVKLAPEKNSSVGFSY